MAFLDATKALIVDPVAIAAATLLQGQVVVAQFPQGFFASRAGTFGRTFGGTTKVGELLTAASARIAGGKVERVTARALQRLEIGVAVRTAKRARCFASTAGRTGKRTPLDHGQIVA